MIFENDRLHLAASLSDSIPTIARYTKLGKYRRPTLCCVLCFDCVESSSCLAKRLVTREAIPRTMKLHMEQDKMSRLIGGFFATHVVVAQLHPKIVEITSQNALHTPPFSIHWFISHDAYISRSHIIREMLTIREIHSINTWHSRQHQHLNVCHTARRQWMCR